MSETRSGYRTSVSGLIGALLITLALIGGVFLLTLFQHRSGDDPVPTVDYSAELAQARSQSPFAVLAPEPVPTGWRATSASWQAAGPEKSWHLGFLTDQGEYVGLEQGNAVPREFVAAKTKADLAGPPADVNGQTWRTLTGGGRETALVRTGDQVTTVVTGTAPRDVLISFAASLTPGTAP